MDPKLTLVLFVIGCVDFTRAVSLSDEIEAEAGPNMVSVNFYDTTQNEFTTDMETAFKEEVVEEANNYCGSSYDECGFMSNWTSAGSFATSDVLIKTYTNTDVLASLKIEFYVTLPSAIPISQFTITDYVLNYNALTTVVTAARQDINAAVGRGVVRINSAEYSPPPNADLNLIISLLAVFIVILLVITCCCCIRAEKKRQRMSRYPKREKIGSGHLSKQRVSPEPTVIVVDKSPDKQNPNAAHAATNNDTVAIISDKDKGGRVEIAPQVVFPINQLSQLRRGETDPTSTPSRRLDSSIDDLGNGNTLTPIGRPNIPPLSEEDEEQKRKKKKERKHRKKHDKSKREEVEMEYATQYNAGSETGEPVFYTSETEKKQLIQEGKESNLDKETRLHSAVSTESTLDRPSTLTTELETEGEETVEENGDAPDTAQLVAAATPLPPNQPTEAW